MRNAFVMKLVLSLMVVVWINGCGSNDNDKAARAGVKASVSSNKTAVAADNLVPAYNFTLETLDGKQVSLKDFKGKALMLNIWDTWCPPCRKEIPDFVELYSEYKSKGLEILGVAGGQNGVEAVAKFIKDNNMNYLNALATPELINGFGGVRSIPTTFMIDKNGNIYKKYVGARPKEVFEGDIKDILNL